MGLLHSLDYLSSSFKNDTETESSIQRRRIAASRFQPQCFYQIERTVLRKCVDCFHRSHLVVLEDSPYGSSEFLSLLLGHHYFEHLLGFVCLQKHQICSQTQGC